MGWLLGCFKCIGKPERAKPKKQLSGVGNLVSGRSNSAAVAHATSPEDLHKVRKSPSDLAAASSKGHIEREPYNPLSSPLQDQAKLKKGAKRVLRQDEDRVWSHEYDLDGELESFRERLMQDANAAKQLSDEVKFLRGCHSLIESPSNTFKVTFDKSDQDSTEQVDYAQHSWLVSSLVTRIQPGGLLIEACPRPSSPLLDFCEGGSFHNRGKHASQSNSFENFGDSNALKCAELSLFRVESGVCDAFVDGIRESLQTTPCNLQCEANALFPERNVSSPPWTFSAAKANEKSSYIFEPSNDLLLEHLDVSSLIQDSALITNWELSSGSSIPETLDCLNNRFLQGPSQDEKKLFVKSESLEQAKQKHSKRRTNGDLFDYDSSYSLVVLDAHKENKPGFSVHPFVDEAFPSNGGNEVVHSEEASISKDVDHLLRAESFVAVEESDCDSTSQSCFSSQFRLSKRVWSGTRKTLLDKESNMGDYLQHNDSNGAQEALLPGMRSNIELLHESKYWEDENHPLLRETSESNKISTDERVSLDDCTDLYNASYLGTSPLEAKVPQDTAKDFPLKDEPGLMMNGNSSMVAFLVEEDGEQRKKIKVEDSSLSGRMQEKMPVKDDEVPLLDAAAFEDGHEGNLEARAGSFSEHESSVSKHVMEDGLAQTPVHSLTFSSSPLFGTPPSVASYRSPARLADDRPILGTVAAHWSPITTRKWWDGKGIPNSTNKYQEDQKVNWHAIPFEVRLEQALAKQDNVPAK